MQKTDIVPLYQKLLYGQVELEENKKTVADLAIPPGAVLNLLTFNQGMDFLDLDVFHGESFLSRFFIHKHSLPSL
jgi:ubiquitin carboxyl-terminal hydrolase 48